MPTHAGCTLTAAQRQQLADRMASLGMTRADLARKLDLSHPAVAYILRGERRPSEQTLTDLAAELGLQVEITHRIEIWDPADGPPKKKPRAKRRRRRD